MHIYFDKEQVSFNEAIDKYHLDEFKSPFRSTIPLLDMIRNGQSLISRIEQELGICGNISYHLEYEVKPQFGRGNASHTDLMITNHDKALAIEAKWTEKRYVAVADWIKKGKNQANRIAVLQGWINYLQPFSPKTLSIEDLSVQVYQMVHRAASVCSFTTKPILAYMQFTETLKQNNDSYIFNDLTSFWNKLGNPENLLFYSIQVLLERNPAFRKIENLKKGSLKTRGKVRDALLSGEKLFEFTDCKVAQIK